MKKTLHIDDKLLSAAREASGAKSDTETVRLGLEALVRSAAYQRMRLLLGSESNERIVKDVPRRREPARPRTGTRTSGKRHARRSA